MSTFVWGDSKTEFFFKLTPDAILEAVEESLETRCTGRVQALNSMENRVFEVELETPFIDAEDRTHEKVIAKFYRPGRWTWEQISEEHAFMDELAQQDINVIAPLLNSSNESLVLDKKTGLMFCLFPKFSGRNPDELDEDQTKQLGRTLARVHIVGSAKKAHHRIQLNVENYGRQNLSFLLQANSIPIEVKNAYEDIVSQICTALDPLFSSVQYLRIHGDLHRGNLLFDRKGFVLVDFDDMLVGPAVQDLWLMIPDRGETGKHRLKILLDGYESLRKFEPSELLIVEGLRALRYIHFSAWIAKRWSDPIFPKMFPQFGTIKYWQDQVQDLREQYSLVLDHDAWT